MKKLEETYSVCPTCYQEGKIKECIKGAKRKSEFFSKLDKMEIQYLCDEYY